MTDFSVGDEIPVTIGRRTFTTYIDKHDVQRFKRNTVIEAFVDASGENFEEWLKTDRTTPQPFNLNTLAVEYHEGKHTLDDMLTFYTSINYSVAGLADVSYFEGLDIRNPVWEADHYTKFSSEALKELMNLINEPYKHMGNDSVRFFHDAVRYDKWTTDGEGYYINRDDTIDRVILDFLATREIEPWDIKVEETTLDELKGFLKHLS